MRRDCGRQPVTEVCLKLINWAIELKLCTLIDTIEVNNVGIFSFFVFEILKILSLHAFSQKRFLFIFRSKTQIKKTVELL